MLVAAWLEVIHALYLRCCGPHPNTTFPVRAKIHCKFIQLNESAERRPGLDPSSEGVPVTMSRTVAEECAVFIPMFGGFVEDTIPTSGFEGRCLRLLRHFLAACRPPCRDPSTDCFWKSTPTGQTTLPAVLMTSTSFHYVTQRD